MKLPSLKPHEVEGVLIRDGWHVVRQKGSHRQYKHPTKRGIVTVPFTKKEVYPELLHVIIKQASLTRFEFLSLR